MADKQVDLNGKTVLNVTKGDVTISNGTIEFHSTYAGGNKSDICIGLDKSELKDDAVISTAKLTLDKVNVKGTVFISYGSELVMNDCEIVSELYGICTNANASKETTAPVKITLTNTKLTAETPVIVNVPSDIILDGCTIQGGW